MAEHYIRPYADEYKYIIEITIVSLIVATRLLDFSAEIGLQDLTYIFALSRLTLRMEA
jgi:hypothetical protein